MDGFKTFLLRGNVVDLAVAVIIGAAFSSIVDSMTRDIITPAIGLIGGQPNFSSIKLGPIGIGNFINAVIAFLIKASVVYFLIVKPFTSVLKLFNSAKNKEETPIPEDVKLLTEIRDLLKKQSR